MADDFSIQIKGLDELKSKFSKFPNEIKKNMRAASVEAGKEVINTVGLQRYPADGTYNQPPEPYYIRGRGTQYKSGNAGNSERYGTKFYVEAYGMGAKAGNNASYAQHLAGPTDNDQVRWARSHGWKSLMSAVGEKMSKIKSIFEAWVSKTLKEIGLK